MKMTRDFRKLLKAGMRAEWLADQSTQSNHRDQDLRAHSFSGVVPLALVSSVLVLCPPVQADPGSVDLSFDAGPVAGTNCCSISGVTSVVVQQDQKIVVGGYFATNNAPANRIERLNSDATIDQTFNIGTGANNDVYATTLQRDGKILVGGLFSSINGIARNCICRLNSDGSVDTTFDPGTGPNSQVNCIVEQTDGKLVIGGTFSAVDGATYRQLARLNSDGTLDTNFNIGTGSGGTYVHALGVQSDGKILAGGYFNVFSGKIHGGLIRLNSDGSPDTTFNTNPGANNAVLAIALQPDGKIIIGGQFLSYNSTRVPYIARLNTNGSLDTNFNLTLDLSALAGVNSLALQPDEKLVIGGSFSANGFSHFAIARFLPDGIRDTNFLQSPTPFGPIYSIGLQLDGRLIVGGEFTNVNGVTRFHLARLDGDPYLKGTLSQQNFLLSWPTSYTGFTLETSATLAGSQGWVTATNPANVVGDQYVVTNDVEPNPPFYRLKR